MKLIKSIMSAFAIVLATTACAGNSGENKKSNEPTKKENKMEVIALNKADFLKKVYNFSAKLLQKSEMRKNMVMDLIYRGFIYAANYSESHYNPRRSQIKTELRYLFVTTPNR